MHDFVKLIVGIVIITGIIFLINKYYNSIEKVYSIAEVVDIHPAMRQDLQVKFKFKYKGRPYIKSHGKGYYNPEIGDTYLVEIPKSNINMAKILVDFPVPDTTQAPFEGWKEKPIFLNKSQ